MAGRIITLQRQARELGRLRTGLTDGNRPVRSDTWIVTSHAEHYVEAAAAEWGGTCEKWQPQGNGAAQFRVITETACLDAILPPGDPLSQSYEMWSRGGCQRRCDGITEQLSDEPCLCVAQFGDTWHEQEKGTVCSAHTRLNVILPQMPDIGVWRMETGSFYAANEIAAHVDLIRNATHGEIAVPIRLRIEQRQRVAAGKTKKFPVVAVELRGSTAGQLMSGTANLDALESLGAPPAAPALTAGNGNGRDWILEADGATDVSVLRDLWSTAKAAGVSDDVLLHITQRASDLAGKSEPMTQDVDELWAMVVAAAPADWSTQQLEEEFAAASNGTFPGAASAEELQAFLTSLKAGAGA